MIDWGNYLGSSEMEVDPKHIIGRSKNLSYIKQKVCHLGKYITDNIAIEIEDNILDEDENKIELGSSYFSKYQLYRVIEEIFKKRLLCKNRKRTIKKAVGEYYCITIEKPIEDSWPLIIKSNDYYYAIAPTIEV